MLLVDTNVIVDVLDDDPNWYPWSSAQMRGQSRVHRLAINPIIFAELSLTFESVDAMDRAVEQLGLVMQELPRASLFLAGKAFARYRRQGGRRVSTLPDFFIGAHAAVNGWPILTRDTARYASYFPGVTLISPPSTMH